MVIAALVLVTALVAAPASQSGRVWLLGSQASAEGLTASGPESSSVVLTVAGAPALPARTVLALGGGAHSTTLTLDADEHHAGFDTELAQRVRSAQHIAFAGGAPRTWFEILFPRQHPSPLARALWDARGSDAILVARGEQALLLAAGFLADSVEEFGETERNPRKLGGPRLIYGLGAATLALVDTHERSEGRIEELCRMLVDERVRVAVYLNPQSGVAFDTDGRQLAGLTAQPAWLFDLRQARRLRDGLRGARFSTLVADATWVTKRRALAASDAARSTLLAVADESVERESEDAFASDALLELFGHDRTAWPRGVVLNDATRELHLTHDARSRVERSPDGALCVSNLRLDLSW